MTPQEEKFALLFNGYKNNPDIQALSDLELRARREELSDIALKANARKHAIDKILAERAPKGPQGFKRSVNDDDISSNALNAVKERQKKQTKEEKILAGLAKLGISSADSAKLMSAGVILKQAKAKDARDKEAIDNPPIPVFNPFEKK